MKYQLTKESVANVVAELKEAAGPCEISFSQFGGEYEIVVNQFGGAGTPPEYESLGFFSPLSDGDDAEAFREFLKTEIEAKELEA